MVDYNKLTISKLLTRKNNIIDGAEALLKNNEYNRKNFGYGFLKPWLGDGILISHGEKWKNRRRMLTGQGFTKVGLVGSSGPFRTKHILKPNKASFHYSILESFREMMIDCTHDFVHLLKSSNESTHDFLGKITPIIYGPYTLPTALI